MADSTVNLRPVPAVDKAARVLRALADGGRPMGISELARGLNVSKGTLRDVLLTLAHFGFVVRDPDTRFRLGPELRSLADASAPVGRRLPIDKGAHAKVLAGRDEIGYDDQELFAGVRAAAAPIVDSRGRRIAVVMVVGFKERVDLRTLRRIGDRCLSAARALSQRIGAEAA